MTTYFRRGYLWIVAAYLVVLSTRCALIFHPPAGYFYNIDELELTLSCLDRFLGLPPTSLQWPGSVIQLLMLPVWAADLIFHQGLPTGSSSALAKLSAWLSGAYANPVHSVLLLRLLVAAISSTAPILAFLIASHFTWSRAAAWICAGIIAFAPVFVQHSVMAVGEAVGFTFALGALLVIVRSGTRLAFWAGFLFAAAISARITLASLVTLPLLLLAFEKQQTPTQRLTGIVRFLFGVFFGFLFWCPYVWTDPIRLAKAVLGHLPSSQSAAFSGAWVRALGVPLSIAAAMSVAGAVYAARLATLRSFVAPALLATAAVSAPLLIANSDLFPRYFLPLLPCILILAAISLSRDQTAPVRSALTVLLGIAVMFMIAESAVQELRLRGPDELAQALDIAKTLGPGTTAYLPEEAVVLYRLPLSKAVYERRKKRASAQLHDHAGLVKYLTLRGISGPAGEVLITAFTEDEQALDARLRAAAQVSGGSEAEYYFYVDPRSVSGIVSERLSPADMTIDEARARHRSGSGSAILLREASSEFGQPFWRGAESWFLYRR